MKKLILILIAVLIAVYITLSVLGRGGEYPAEKLLYHAMKQSAKITGNPDVLPPKLMASIEADLQKLVGKYPDTAAAKNGYMVLARFYMFSKNHDKAIATLDKIIKKYSSDTPVLSTAQFLKGIAYEKQGDWDSALKEFTILRDNYSNTQLGMQIPLYIAKYYETKGEDAKAQDAYKEAALFYGRMSSSNSNNARGYIASMLLIETYANAKDYERAGEVLDDTIRRYASPRILVQLIPYVDAIFIGKLNRTDKAIEIYKSMKEKIKNDKVEKFLQEKIDKLEADRGQRK